MSEYDCVGVTSEYLDSLKNKIEELEQDIEEYERRLYVSNETIDIYEELVKHVETQRDDLYQELQSNEMLIEELKNQKAELIEALRLSNNCINHAREYLKNKTDFRDNGLYKLRVISNEDLIKNIT